MGLGLGGCEAGGADEIVSGGIAVKIGRAAIEAGDFSVGLHYEENISLKNPVVVIESYSVPLAGNHTLKIGTGIDDYTLFVV